MTKKSVKMWGVFSKRGMLYYVRPLKEDADELASDMKLGDDVRPVTVSWTDGKPSAASHRGEGRKVNKK